MKRKIYTILACLAAGLFTMSAQEDESYMKKFIPDKFSLDAGVYTRTSDFDSTASGYTLGLTAYWTENLGLGLETRSRAQGGVWAESSHARMLFRAPISETFSLTPYAGVVRQWELREFGLEAGLRVDQKVWKNIGVYAQAGWEKGFDANQDHAAVGAVGLSIGF